MSLQETAEAMSSENQIRKIRESLGLTQFEFAAKLRTNNVTVWRWERGKTKPSRAYRRALDRLARRARSEPRNEIADS